MRNGCKRASNEDALCIKYQDQKLRAILRLAVITVVMGFRCLQQSGLDTTTSTGKLLLGVLASIAEFETDIRRERQREGIDRAKAAGVYRGRKPTVDAASVREMHAGGTSPTQIAKELKIGRASVYRALKV